MPTKEIFEKALLESLEHWEENVRNFPYRSSIGCKDNWFRGNCLGTNCPLCRLLGYANKEGKCWSCPLNDEPSSECCDEWKIAADEYNIGDLRKHHIKAVADRIKHECEKRGLLKGD